MVYNPIFEEEKEKKLQFKQLKKEIKKRARKQKVNTVIDRVYNLLHKKPMSMFLNIFEPVISAIKPTRTKEV